MSTPTYPQSNGKVEAAVKSMKKFIQAAWTGSQVDEGRLARSLLQYRNTPSGKDNLSETIWPTTLSYLCRTSFMIESGTIAVQNTHPPISGEIGETAIWRKFTRFALTFFVVKPRRARRALV